MIRFRFLAGFLTGVLLTSIYNNPAKTKEVINKTIDFITNHKDDVSKYNKNFQENLEEKYQRAKDLQKGWDE